jgi:hypothetical protein
MQALIELIIGFVALVAAAALSQFGLQLDTPQKADREIHRVQDCREQPAAHVFAAAEDNDDC